MTGCIRGHQNMPKTEDLSIVCVHFRSTHQNSLGPGLRPHPSLPGPGTHKPSIAFAGARFYSRTFAPSGQKAISSALRRHMAKKVQNWMLVNELG